MEFNQIFAYALTLSSSMLGVLPVNFRKSTRVMVIDNRQNFVSAQYFENKYSRLSLSRTRLFRITAYLEVKIWSLF